jgi:hypothetical protein
LGDHKQKTSSSCFKEVFKGVGMAGLALLIPLGGIRCRYAKGHAQQPVGTLILLFCEPQQQGKRQAGKQCSKADQLVGCGMK